MQAGKLRHRLVIEALTAGSPQKTATGAPNETWATHATVWGSLEPLTGRRLESAQAKHERVTVEAKIRHLSTVVAGMRINYGGKYYPINVVVNPQTRNESMRLLCEEGARSG